MALIDSLTQSTLSLSGETPKVRPGAEAINDIHFVGGQHVHSDPEKPISQLASDALTLAGSKFSKAAPYVNPER